MVDFSKGDEWDVGRINKNNLLNTEG